MFNGNDQSRVDTNRKMERQSFRILYIAAIEKERILRRISALNFSKNISKLMNLIGTLSRYFWAH